MLKNVFRVLSVTTLLSYNVYGAIPSVSPAISPGSSPTDSKTASPVSSSTTSPLPTPLRSPSQAPDPMLLDDNVTGCRVVAGALVVTKDPEQESLTKCAEMLGIPSSIHTCQLMVTEFDTVISGNKLNTQQVLNDRGLGRKCYKMLLRLSEMKRFLATYSGLYSKARLEENNTFSLVQRSWGELNSKLAAYKHQWFNVETEQQFKKAHERAVCSARVLLATSTACANTSFGVFADLVAVQQNNGLTAIK